MKKRWLIVPIMAGLVALFATAGAILAQGNGSRGGAPLNGVVSRMAEILGLEETTVHSAFNQAVREQQDAAVQSKLNRLVNDEKLTQEQADDVIQWYRSRPDPALYLRGIIFRSEEAVQRILDRMVEMERITQEEADQVAEWHHSRPDDLPTRGYGRGSKRHGSRHGLGRGDSGANDMRSFRVAPQTSTPQVAAPTILH